MANLGKRRPHTTPGNFAGFTSGSRLGASSDRIFRPEGNRWVDSPHFTPPRVTRLEFMRGGRWLFLTHRDAVADHQRFQEHFGGERVQAPSADNMKSSLQACIGGMEQRPYT